MTQRRGDTVVRRVALSRLGAMLGAGALSGCAGRIGPLGADEARRRVEGRERDGVEAGAPPIVRALTLGLHAPSPHNTQAWRFRVVSETEALLFVDRARLLPETDPPARQIHIGCGCFIEAFALGAGRLGWRPEVELFPDGEYRDASEVGARPVARLALRAGGEAEPLSRWIEARQTSRLPYTGPMVDAAAFGKVAADVSPRAARIALVETSRLARHVALLSAAMKRETTNLPTNEETRRWFRFDDQELAERRDGFGFEANGVTGITATFAEWLTSDTRESWNDPSTIEKALAAFDEGVRSARGLVLVSTEANEHRDQLAAGRDCYRLLLALTKHGYVAHPVNQILQEYEAMGPLRGRFEELTGVQAPAKVQMILRIGRSEVPFRSFRRHLPDMLGEQKW